ncbi:SsrA-binding protein SmpB [Acetohalobium arabaticum]|uniref:SsrA-binding protein n=1 Tax=Acetohalobium arabaticum (strain ATCC 49924 / DSM 5501 / Z-7288) TaxID=574087 RepID=D9QU89_ACEAZ|nr:SsrA-binding protein SmpB [Acetohalobium arabaticum]ADL11882.1 SsrA-binding protein [Acetohalobium arabaticum DSM 5501]
MSEEGIKVIARNRKAKHEYHIEETYEAGIVLQGTEVKSIRQGRANLKDSFAIVEDEEVFLYHLHIAPYKQGNRYNHKPERVRKLLLHKRQIRSLIGKTREQGYTLIPLKLYFRRGIVKVELALAEGKNVHDKREDIKRRTAQRDIERAFKDKQLNRY